MHEGWAQSTDSKILERSAFAWERKSCSYQCLLFKSREVYVSLYENFGFKCSSDLVIVGLDAHVYKDENLTLQIPGEVPTYPS